MDEIVKKHLDNLMLGEIADKNGLVYASSLQQIGKYKNSVKEMILGNSPKPEVSYIVKEGGSVYKKISGILLGRFQRAAGVSTPEVGLLITNPDKNFGSICTIQKCFKSNEDIEVQRFYNGVLRAKYEISDEEFEEGYDDLFVESAEDFEVYDALRKELRNLRKLGKSVDRWEVLRNPNLRAILETVMTPECLDEYLLTHLLRELSGDIDGNGLNNLMWNEKGEIKKQGVVPIDFEESIFLVSYIDIVLKREFDKFATGYKYFATTPIDREDPDLTYETRIKMIRDLIAEGHLSKRQIEGIKQALGFDLEKEYGQICDVLNIENQSPIYRRKYCMALLQGYNREMLGSELGL